MREEVRGVDRGLGVGRRMVLKKRRMRVRTELKGEIVEGVLGVGELKCKGRGETKHL